MASKEECTEMAELIREGQAAGLSLKEINAEFQRVDEIIFHGPADDRAQLLRASFQAIDGGKKKTAPLEVP